jgi:hypothetical protein
MTFISITYENSVCTSQREKTAFLRIPVMGKIGVRSETHTKHIKRAALCGTVRSLFVLTVGGMYSYHWALSG